MNLKNLTVCKSNEVIEAGYKLSLSEQRVVLACIAQVNSKEELLTTDRFELSAKDFAKWFGISEDRSYSELQEVAKNLYQRSLTIYNPDPTRPKLKKLETRWISSIGYMPEEGKIILRFAQDIIPYLSELKGQFTRYELKYVGNMTSIYGIRLYELLMQWKKTGKREIEIDWLKKQLQLDESYSRMDNLKARVITPAVKDINTHSNYEVSWTQRKTGRKVTHLTFEFSEKKPVVPSKKPRAKIKVVKQPTTEANEIKIDNLDYFADVRKRYKGKFNEQNVPQDIVEKLKEQGRW
jgi:plasmid replication initiation protein